MNLFWKGPGIYAVKIESKVKIAIKYSDLEPTQENLKVIADQHKNEGLEFFAFSGVPKSGEKRGTQEIKSVSE